MDNKDLNEWADKVEKEIPVRCEKCGELLPQIKYAHDTETIAIQLTGVSIERDFFKAICPHCGKILRKECVKFSG